MPPPFARPLLVSEDVRSLFQSADLVIGNLETPVGDDRVTAHHFQISEKTLASVLDALGIAPKQLVLSIANNHIGDLGAVGVRTTLNALSTSGITPIGAGPSGRSPVVRVAAGRMSVDLVAWSDWINRPLPSGGTAIASRDEALLCLKARGSSSADVTVAYPHWGYEFQHGPRPRDREVAAELARNGVHLVVGHHPHVIQPAEVQGTSLCVYSLGGLIQSQGVALRWPVRLGCLLVVDFSPFENQADRLGFGYQIVPVVHAHDRREHRVALLDEASDRDQKRMKPRFDLICPPA